MSDDLVMLDLVMLKAMIVSDRVAEREALRRAASQMPVPVDVIELDASAAATVICDRMVQEKPDIVVIDTKVAQNERRLMIEAARLLSSKPLVVVFACSDAKLLEVIGDGLVVDGMTTAPIGPQRALALLQACVRARIGSHVLIVDHSTIVRSIVRKVLNASRFRLVPQEAGNASAAVDWALRQPFDIVFLDCEMPGRDGFSILAELRLIRPDIKVVMMTTANDPAIRKRVHDAGAHDLLVKPFYADDIDAILNRLFGLMQPLAA